MNFYLDDNLVSRKLSQHLQKARHSVALPADANLAGASDPRHLLHALTHDLTMLTGNHKDFADLHNLVIGSKGSHAGIVLIYFDNDPTRDMKSGDIVRALGKLEKAQIPVADQLIVLNHWR